MDNRNPHIDYPQLVALTWKPDTVDSNSLSLAPNLADNIAEIKGKITKLKAILDNMKTRVSELETSLNTQ